MFLVCYPSNPGNWLKLLYCIQVSTVQYICNILGNTICQYNTVQLYCIQVSKYCTTVLYICQYNTIKLYCIQVSKYFTTVLYICQYNIVQLYLIQVCKYCITVLKTGQYNTVQLCRVQVSTILYNCTVHRLVQYCKTVLYICQ